MTRFAFNMAAPLALVTGLAAGAAETGAPQTHVRDFDWESGKWSTHVRRLQHPLSTSSSWIEYDGTTVVSPLLEGRANVAELRITGAAGRIEGTALRVYQPQAQRWAIHYFSAANGELGEPVYGRFDNGVGHFEGKDSLGDRAILVRFEIRESKPGHWHFEQAFSADQGRTWEVNWIADDERAG